MTSFRVKFSPLALSTVSLLSLLFLFPWSLSTQTSSFSLSLDLDSSEGDQSISSLDVFPNRTVSIQIFGTDIQQASDISLRFEFDPTQVAYEGFDAGDILPNAQVVGEQNSSSVQINMASDGSATVNAGLIGTIHFRTTDAFLETDIRLVRAELIRDEQPDTASLSLSVALLSAASSPDFDNSGTVGIPDFLLFVDAFGSKEGQEQYEAKYDLNGDGEIGIPDFLTFVDSFGKEVNRVPIFASTPPVTRSVDENTPSGQPIGELISATDGDGDILTYRLSGADADSFAIDPSTGQIQTKGKYDFEQKSSYSVIVIVSDDEGGKSSLVVTIAITDMTN